MCLKVKFEYENYRRLLGFRSCVEITIFSLFAPYPSSPTGTDLAITLQEFQLWRKLCSENSGESEETCFKFM